MATFTDQEYGDIAQALRWPRARLYRVPFPPGPGVVTGGAFLLGAKLERVDDDTKALAIALSQLILARQSEAWTENFDGLPDVQKFGALVKDAAFGHRVRSLTLDEMRAELALMIDYCVNPAFAPQGVTRVMG